MLKKFTILILFLLLTLLNAGTISGTITNEATGEPLIGANVFIIGTNLGTATDFDGKFHFPETPDGLLGLRISYIGYSTVTKDVELDVDGSLDLNVLLSKSMLNLKEIVVTGAGVATEKERLGNTVATIDMRRLEDAPITSFSDILQGREPGVVISPNGGINGEGSTIRIRGSSSLTQSNEPVVYVDGIRVDNTGGFAGYGYWENNTYSKFGEGGIDSRLDDINPDAIERVEILKGAAAATLYGTQAANGIIQIFTKQGSIGKPKYSFKFEQSSSNYPMDRIQPQAGFARDSSQAESMTEFYGSEFKIYDDIRVQAHDYLFSSGSGRSMSASVSGGNEGITYFANLRYIMSDGPYEEGAKIYGYPTGGISDKYDQFQLSSTLNIIASEKLRLRLGTNYNHRLQNIVSSSNNPWTVTNSAYFGMPEYACTDCDIDGDGENENSLFGKLIFGTTREFTFQEVSQETDHMNVNLNANYYHSDDLTIEATGGVDIVQTGAYDYWPYGSDVDNFYTANADGSIFEAKRTGWEYTIDVRAILKKQFTPDIHSTFVTGFQAYNTINKRTAGWGKQFSGPGLEVLNATGTNGAFSSFSEVIEAGYFFQEQLAYQDYAYVTLGLRQDANSAFGTNFSTVTYPKFGVSFVPTNMMGAFGPLTTLRLRAGWGQSGQQPGAFDQFTTFQPSASEEGPGLIPGNLGNPDLKPEVTTEIEVGAEFGLMNDKIGVSLNKWNRVTKDGLFAQQFPPSGGFQATQLGNVGEWEGNGYEFDIKALVYESFKTNVEIFFNASYTNEIITDLNGMPAQKVGGSYPRYRNYLNEGYAPGALFGAKLASAGDCIAVNSDGSCETIFQSGDLPIDITGDGLPDPMESLTTYLAFDEVAYLAQLDGWAPVIALPTALDSTNSNARVVGDPLGWYLGNPEPDWQGSFGFNMDFLKNFRLTALLEFKRGNYYVTNLGDAFRHHYTNAMNTPATAEINKQFATGGLDSNNNPQYDSQVRLDNLLNYINNYLALSPYSGLNTMEKGDFVRLREVGLTYTLPREFVEGFNLGSAALSFKAKNLLLFTNYSGVDPESNAGGRNTNGGINNNFVRGIDMMGMPLQREYILTFKVNF